MTLSKCLAMCLANLPESCSALIKLSPLLWAIKNAILIDKHDISVHNDQSILSDELCRDHNLVWFTLVGLYLTVAPEMWEMLTKNHFAFLNSLIV